MGPGDLYVNLWLVWGGGGGGVVRRRGEEWRLVSASGLYCCGFC